MNALTKPNDPSGSLGLVGSMEKNKQWQRELLMERLRSHSMQHKTFPELSKTMRMSMLEKRYALDTVEKSNLQKCLDSMQHCIKVTSRQGLVERLESLSRQLGLKFMEDTSGLFISSDMFYLEIILDANGALSDVKVHHECKIEQQSCSELVNCLLRNDFADFTVQLEGLTSIYQLNAEPKVKSKAFVALQAMETDLYNLFQSQSFHKDTQVVLMESSVGIVTQRRGGHPMKLTYFISPYDLIDVENKSLNAPTYDLVSTKNVGMNATVNLEASSANKLQISPTVTFSQDSLGVNLPIYAPLTATNSTLLPATFVLRLNKPLPVFETMLRSIIPSHSEIATDKQPLTYMMKLVVQTASEGQLQNFSKGLFVSLPDQNHCYFFTENKQQKATLVSSVPYTEPSQVPNILGFLRRQALFYTLLASCVRTQGKIGDFDSTTIIEVNAISIYQISVAFEHPYEESMAMVEFDLTNVNYVTCQIYSLSNSYDALATKLSKIVQISLSIPVTIRALLKHWEQERLKSFQRGGIGPVDNGNFNIAMGPNDPGGSSNSGGNKPGGEFRDVKNLKSNGANMNGGRQFFHNPNMPMNAASSPSQQSQEGFNMFNAPPGSAATGGPNNAAIMKQFKGEMKQEDFCNSPKSNLTQSEISNDSISLGFNAAAGQQQSGASSLPPMARGVAIPSTVKSDKNRAEEIAEKYQKIWKDKTSMKNTVSITPIPSTSPASTNVSNIGLDKRPGIEIIPITSTTPTPPSTITITPINSSGKGDKKSSSRKPSSSSDDKDKKRKKKRDDSPMGPPEKLIFTSPSSSSPKSSLASASSTRPSPKHSPVYSSPKHASNSPKSPFGTLSPKHGSSGKPSMSTLKSATTTTSPKNEKSSSASPLLSSSSVSATSSKASLSVFRDKPRDKETNKSPSPKIKTATIKLKPIDFDGATAESATTSSTEPLTPSFLNTDKTIEVTAPPNNQTQNRARKGSLSAVIDKLKSAQNSGDEIATIGSCQVSLTSQQQTTLPLAGNSTEYMIKPSQDGMKITINKTRTKDPKSKSSQKVSSPAGSPKKHTGLKPGVNSGPASKKTSSPSASIYPTKSLPSGLSLTLPNQATKHSFQKSNSSGSLPSSSSSTSLASSKNAASASSHSLTKSLSANSFNSDTYRKSSSSMASKQPSKSIFNSSDKLSARPDPTDVMKILQYASPNNAALEGFMKSLNTKFQIPKLSARSISNTDNQQSEASKNRPTSAPTTPVLTSFSPSPTPNSSESSGSSNDSNKPTTSFQKFSSTPCTPMHVPSPFTSPQLTSAPSSSSPSHRAPHSDSNPFPPVTNSDELTMRPPSAPGVVDMTSAAPTPSPILNSQKSSELNLSMKPEKLTSISSLPPIPPPLPTSGNIASSMSASRKILPTTNKIPYPPASPSVSVHILKSPVPSPLMVMPSPHSSSPCITDDELMDEALCGIGSK